MNLIAKNIQNIAPSPVFAITAKARAIKATGAQVFDFGIGEPECGTPQNIKDAAIAAIKAEKTLYTPMDGIPALKAAICDRYNVRANGIFALDNVIVSSGAKYILYSCLAATIEEGDEVILLAPYWVSYHAMVQICGGKPVVVKCKPENDFKIDVELLEKAVTSKTKWLLINSPNNPTGVKYSRAELGELAAFIKRHPNLHLISDDIYEALTYDGHVDSMIDVAPEIADRMLIVNGVSKSYAMTGWRIGYGVGSRKLIKAMLAFQSQTLSCPCSISQYAALEALTGNQSSISNYMEVLKTRRDISYKFFTQTLGFQCTYPTGAFYVFPSCSKIIGKLSPKGEIISNDIDFCSYLLDDAKVCVTPGEVFECPNYFRLSYAVSEEDLRAGLEAIKEAVSKLQ